eukprot:scaffold765_cov160-Amphora_coffeaeformis.AAC.2
MTFVRKRRVWSRIFEKDKRQAIKQFILLLLYQSILLPSSLHDTPTARIATMARTAPGQYVIPKQHGRIPKDMTFNLRMSPVEEDEKVSTAGSPLDVERPEPSLLLSAQPDTVQRLGFIAICVAAGVAHFAMKDTFTAMVPPKGTWGGLWQVPAPGADKLGLTYEEFHSYWSGICEIGGGILLIIGGFNQSPQFPAFLLFLLTAAVTPANIYMATHDAQAPGLPPIPYPWGHIGRFAAQSVLLGLFLKLAFQQ